MLAARWSCPHCQVEWDADQTRFCWCCGREPEPQYRRAVRWPDPAHWVGGPRE